MPYLKTEDGVNLFYNDWGHGHPVVLIHGWPLDHSMWSSQAVFLAENGFRVIAYDRRGFGRSDQPWDGYNYNTLSDDLACVIDSLNLEKAALVGFSMGGGEIARYLNRHGSGRIDRVALVASITPFMLKTEDNPGGLDRSVFDQMITGLSEDRPGFMTDFGMAFYGNGLLTSKVSQDIIQWSGQVAMMASLRATLECVKAFASTDFRPDMKCFDVPTLIIHGTSDQTVPTAVSARPARKLIPDAELIEYQDEPHGLFITARDRLNTDLLNFLQHRDLSEKDRKALRM
jgi:non-heme chloroperoxidase